MRIRVLVISALFVWGCNRSSSETISQTHVTRIVVSPDEFLGEVSCGLPGGMESYQATLYDVTEGLGRAFQLPSSKVVSCRSNVNFERVLERHSYIATIVGFDRSGYKSQNPGSPIVVDENGKSVAPQFRGTCWGSDEARDEYAAGGAGPVVDGQGGITGADNLGAVAYYRTEILVRGCTPLEVDKEPDPTAIEFDLSPSLQGLECGHDAGQVQGFEIRVIESETGAQGGAGGSGGAEAEDSQQVACGESLIWEDWPQDERLGFEVLALDGATSSPAWSTTCSATTQPNVTVSASCGSFLEL